MIFRYIVLLFVFILNLLLGVVVLRANQKNKTNFTFFILTIVTSLWVLTNVLMGYFNSVTFLKINLSIASYLPISALWWAHFFLRRKKGLALVAVLTIISTFFAFLPYVGNLMIEKVDRVVIGSLEGSYGDAFVYYASYLIIVTFYLFEIFYRAQRNTKGIFKDQISYIIFGIFGFAAVPITLSLILPIFQINAFAGLDSFGSLILIGSISYAIARHRLFDIKALITRSLVYGILLTVVTLSIVFITILLAPLFGKSQAGQVAASIIVAALIVFGLDPLKRLLSVATDKVFFKAKVDYQAVLRDLTEILSVEIDQTNLIRRLRQTLQEELKLKSAATLLAQGNSKNKDRFEALPELLDTNPNLKLTADGPIVQYLVKNKQPVLLETLERIIEDTPEAKRPPLEAERAEVERLGAALVAPVFSQNQMNAVLVLGPKLSGDSFSNDDLQLIDVLGPQIGSAIQKANLFEEVRQFGESLKVKIEEATLELKERNVSLVTLQSITKDITRTLDFSRVVQGIADAVATELGYIGAILVFLDDDGKTVRARAITNTPLTAKAMKLLPKPFGEYVTELGNPKDRNLAHDVIRSGEVRFTEDFSEVISPPVPRLLAKGIEKLIRLKTVALVPIVSEEKVIGCIEVGMRKAQAEISEHEIETIKSMADQLGVVSRNLHLFSQIQKANQDLEVANKHLQQLDQAKSEFVSIASHQLRTPMTGIMGYLSMMVSGDFGQINPKHLIILRTLLDESQRMIRLINLFLNVSKIEAGKFTISKKDVQLADIIGREVNELNKIAADKKLKLRFVSPKQPLPVIVADADKLQDVLLNLIDNAIKYTAKGSITVSAEADNGGVAVHVKDTGIGIKPSDIKELFNKFVRAQGIAQIHPDGSGLGLFIAKSVVEGHGGRIWVESDGLGKGSTFSFWLPVSGEVGTTTLKGAL